jgi:predicted dehydrogenase/nucleoside-diphosphate-sugar epimerase
MSFTREHGDSRHPVKLVQPVRVAVIGCGAIAREIHLPVLAGHDGVRVVALVDRDVARAGELAQAYGVGTVLADAAELTRGQVDAVVIATPPAHHAQCAIDLAGRGLHVLVEKPMALTAADARAMVEAADDASVVLAVGLFRRLYPSMRLLRGLIASGHLGRPVGFDIEAGSPYGWPLATLANLRKDLGGGGVFIDIAPHLLDQLLHVLPGAPELVEYQDNARGGIETDCGLRLRVNRNDGEVIEGRIELSRTRKLRNTIRIDCELGSYELPSGERFRVDVRPSGLELADDLQHKVRPHTLQAAWADEIVSPGFAAYRAQLDDWLAAIRTGGTPELSGASALPVVSFIEECYRSAEPLAEPWAEVGLRPRVVCGADIQRDGHPNKVPATPRGRSPGRVLVTGATGFVGCRTAEILALKDGWEVRGLVRDPARAARLARLPVEMVLGDLRDAAALSRAVQGCDAVVHCAIGTEWGRRRDIFEVTVGGTKRLAEASRAAGVRRFVHVSTVAIHGKDVADTLDESTPVRPPAGDDYAESKAEAERVVEAAVRAGLPAVTLRLANVYGPFSTILTSRPIEHLARGMLALVGGEKKPSNMVYVDNVAGAIGIALATPAETTVGESFAVSDGDDMTYADFYRSFARRLGAPSPTILSAPPRSNDPPRPGGLRAWLQAWKGLLTSPEIKALAKRYLNADPVGRLPRRILTAPAVERRVRRLFGMDQPLAYRPESADDSPGCMVMNPIAAFVNPAKIRRVLGFSSTVPTERAIELTLAWVLFARLMPAIPIQSRATAEVLAAASV